MQVQVADVAAELAGRGHAHQRVHVGAIHVHAAAALVDQGAQVLDLGLEHAVRAGVGDHHRGQLLAVLFALGLQVGQIDVALLVALGDHHLQARHLRAGRVGAVRAAGDQADVALAIAAGRVPGADGQQARVFALRTGVGLQADAGVAGDGAEPLAQLGVQLGIAGQLIGRREGVHLCEFRPGDGDHLAGGVELHGATAQRDHAAVQRQVLVGELAQVAQHAGFAVMHVEHRVREESAGAAQGGRDQRLHAFFERIEGRQGLAVLREDRPEQGDVLARAGFVQRHAHVLMPRQLEVRALGQRLRHEALGLRGVGGLDGQGIEGRGAGQRAAQLLQASRQHRGVGGHALRDALEALRAVVDGVHAGHDGGQHLRRADVGGGLFAADVLLARLQRQPVGRVAVRVHAHADQTTGQRALELVAAGHVGSVWAAGAHGHAEALGGADRDVGVELARRHQQRQRQQVGGDDEGGLFAMHRLHVGAQVVDAATGRRVLRQHGEVVVGGQRVSPFLGRVRQLHAQAQRLGAGLDDLDGLRMCVAGNHDGVALGLDRSLGQRHGFGGGGGFVEHRRVGDRHAGQVGHHGLEVDQRLHAALRYLGLVGRVGGVPGRVLQDVSQDHARRVGAVVALADEASVDLVFAGNRLEFGQRGGFGGGGRQLHGGAARDAARHDAFDQRVARGLADDGEHVRLVGGADADVAGDEFARVFQAGEIGGLGHGGLRAKPWARRTTGRRRRRRGAPHAALCKRWIRRRRPCRRLRPSARPPRRRWSASP